MNISVEIDEYDLISSIWASSPGFIRIGKHKKVKPAWQEMKMEEKTIFLIQHYEEDFPQ